MVAGRKQIKRDGIRTESVRVVLIRPGLLDHDVHRSRLDLVREGSNRAVLLSGLLCIGSNGVGHRIAFHFRKQNVAFSIGVIDHLGRIINIFPGRIGPVHGVVDRCFFRLFQLDLLGSLVYAGSRIRRRRRKLVGIGGRQDVDDQLHRDLLGVVFKPVRIVFSGHRNDIFDVPVDVCSLRLDPCLRGGSGQVSLQHKPLPVAALGIIRTLYRGDGIPLDFRVDLLGFNGPVTALRFDDQLDRLREVLIGNNIHHRSSALERHLTRTLHRQHLGFAHIPDILGRVSLVADQGVGNAHDHGDQTVAAQFCRIPVNINLQVLGKDIAVGSHQREFRRIAAVELEVLLVVRIVQQVVEDRDHAGSRHHRKNLDLLQEVLDAREDLCQAIGSREAHMLRIDKVPLGKRLVAAGLRRAAHDDIHALDDLLLVDLVGFLILKVRLDLDILVGHGKGNHLLDGSFLQLQAVRLDDRPALKLAGAFIHSRNLVDHVACTFKSEQSGDGSHGVSCFLESALVVGDAVNRRPGRVLAASGTVGHRHLMLFTLNLVQELHRGALRRIAALALLHAIR